ncbi:MAG: radical SAM/SPASM domain-containing protein [Candidatus Thiodiazotropha sp.]
MNRSYDFPSQHAAQFPNIVVVAVNNRCNFSCVHCYYHKYVRTSEYRPHDLDAEVFERIVSEMGQYPWSVLRLIGWGEPLRHPHLLDFVALAHQVAPRNPITLITNGYDLSSENSLALMESGLDLVEISIDAASAGYYEHVRPSHDPNAFSRVETNVEAMISQRNAHGFSTRVAVSFILWPNQESKVELNQFRHRWANLADEVIVRPLHSFIGTVTSVASYNTSTNRPPCYALWGRFAINPWGEASVCYNDWSRHDLLGDLHDPQVTIADIWRGPILEQLRRQQCAGRFTGICEKCQDHNPGSWEHPYEKVVSRCQVFAKSRDIT